MLTNFHINPEEFGLGRSASLQMSGNSLLKICVLLALGLQTLQTTPEAHVLSSLPGADLMTPVILMIKAADIYNAQSPKPIFKQTIKKTKYPTPKRKNKKRINMRTTTARMSLFPRKEPPPSTPKPVVVRNPYTMSYRATDPIMIAKLGSTSYMQQLSYPTTKITQGNN